MSYVNFSYDIPRYSLLIIRSDVKENILQNIDITNQMMQKKLFFNHNEVDRADILTRIEVGLDVKQFVTNNNLKEYIALKNTYLQNYLIAEYVSFVIFISQANIVWR